MLGNHVSACRNDEFFNSHSRSDPGGDLDDIRKMKDLRIIGKTEKVDLFWRDYDKWNSTNTPTQPPLTNDMSQIQR